VGSVSFNYRHWQRRRALERDATVALTPRLAALSGLGLDDLEQTADHREQASDGLVKVLGPNGTVSEDQAAPSVVCDVEGREWNDVNSGIAGPLSNLGVLDPAQGFVEDRDRISGPTLPRATSSAAVRDRESMRAALLDAAAALFLERGYHATSLHDVARIAGMRKPLVNSSAGRSTSCSWGPRPPQTWPRQGR
jgi:hypothetical protein